MEKPRVALIDGNNFFVSCERLFRPDLAKRPVLVLSSNDGCVVARSQEVKDMGIPMGVPYFQIRDIIKDNGIHVFSSNFSLYRDLSRRLFSLVRQEVGVFEQYSIDEGFFLLPAPDALNFGRRLRDRIIRELGLPVSIGIAPSKTLAKLAARRAKRGMGVEELSLSKWAVLSPEIALGELWGVGSRRALAFRAAGLVSAHDLCAVDRGWIKTQFGVEGERLWAELNGHSAYPVTSESHLKQSIMHSRSFGRGVVNKAAVLGAIFYHVQRAANDLDAMSARASRMYIFIGSGRGGGVMGRRDILFGVPTSDPLVLLAHAKSVVEDLYEHGVVYKRAGVTLGGIVSKDNHSLTLFSEVSKEGEGRDVGALLREIKTRWGSEAISIGLTKEISSWQPKRELVSPAYTTRWDQLPQAAA